MLKAKEIENIELSSHSTSRLKSKSSCGQSSINVFLNKSLRENKPKLNMNTSQSCCGKFQF